MASFTDAISQFNPYVQQLPVEAMVQVGMYKQGKYDEGVQKIQGYIDNIAGLDIIKPEHKQYLQSKINALGSDLRSVSAGDFSNQQLVNSVSGMTSQIIKDRNIQNAVASTQQVRKQMNDREEARKAGKSSIVNDSILDKRINAWLSDGKMDTSFNYKYRQYQDIEKKLMEISSKVPEIDSSIDQPYKTDAAGNTLYFTKDKNGNDVVTTADKGTPMIDEAMKRITAKGKSASKLYSNFIHGLNEDEMEQLKMNAEYHYEGSNLDALKKDLTLNYNTQKRMLMNEAVDLDVDIKTNGKLSDAEKARMQARIVDINEQLSNGTLDKQLNEKLSQLEDPNTSAGLKAKLYTENYLSGRATDMSNLSYKQSLETNPYMQVQMQYKQLQARYDQLRQNQKQFEAKYAQDERQFAVTTAQKEREIAQKERELAGLEPLAFDAPISTDVESVNMGMLDGKIKDNQDAIKALDGRYAGIIAGDQKTVEGKKKVLDDLFAKYKMNPSSITDNTQREYLQKRFTFEDELATNLNLGIRVRQETAAIDEELDAALSSAKGVTFANGKSLFSGKELFEVRNAVQKLRSSGAASLPGLVAGSSRQYKEFDADELVKRFRGSRMEPIAVAYAKQAKGAKLTPTEQSIVGIGNNIYSAYSGSASNINERKLQKEAEVLNRLLPERQTKVGVINPQNKNDQARFKQLMALKADEFGRMGALDTDKFSDYNEDTFKELRESGTTTYTIERRSDGSAIVTARDGSKSQKFSVTAQELRTALPNVAKTHPLDGIKFQIASSPNGTTNAQGLTYQPGAAVSAKFTGYNLPGLMNTKLAPLVRYDIEGSQSNNGSATDGFQVRLYVNQNGIWKSQVLNQAGWATPDGVLEIINNIGPATVSNVLSKK